MSIERTGAVSGYKSHKEINFESKQTLSALLADFRIIKKFNEIIVPLHDKISLMMMDSFNYLDSRDKLMPHLFHDKLKL